MRTAHLKKNCPSTQRNAYSSGADSSPLWRLSALWVIACVSLLYVWGCEDESPRSDVDASGETMAGISAADGQAGEIAGEMIDLGSSGSMMNGGEMTAGSTGGTSAPGEQVLRIAPREVTLTVRMGQEPPTQVFELSLVSERGETPLDAGDVVWTVEPETLGVVVGGTFRSNVRPGSGQIFAEYTPAGSDLTLITSASVTVTAPQDVIGDGISDQEVIAFDEAPLATSCAPLSFVYPAPSTVIPLNLRGFSFQWASGGTSGPYLITAQSGDAQLRWFTQDDLLTPEGIPWESAKLSAPDGVTEWSVSYLTASGERCDGPPLTLIIDRSQLTGAVYYWSTRDSGIMRLAAGERAPEPLLTPSVAPEINCPACHALSRDGTRIAFTRTTFPPFGDLTTSTILNPRDLLYDPSGVEGYFPSFSPDPNVLIAGSSGRLVIRDSNTGAELEALTLPPSTVGGSPDWSWRGDRITAVVGPAGLANPIPNAGISSGSIYEWVQRGEDWGDPVELIPPTDGTWNNRPAYSPEGTFIAYNVEGDNPNSSDESMGNPNVDLWIKRVGDASAPVRLERANGGVLQGNSWPKWSPHDRRGRLWLAFSSTRDYGHQLAQDIDTPTPQIWVTSIDPNAPPGQDPSSPAFWLPYQSLDSGNHIPYWAPYEKR